MAHCCAGLGSAPVLCMWLALVSASASIQPFPLSSVRLGDDPDFKTGFELNNQYLLLLEPDSLLYTYRLEANLSTPGKPYGGWEAPTVEVRGQFMGHYLSALAFATLNTGREDLAQRGLLMVDELKKAQDAHGNGYLSAFPQEHFDRLESLKPVWAPYYVIHKIMQGLLDQHTMVANPLALGMVEDMAKYFCNRVERVVESRGEDYWLLTLNTEFGGMNEVLYNLFSETGRREYADCARRFDKPAFLEPLLQGRDPLPGLHANTHLAQVNGFAARYDSMGDKAGATAVHNFFALLEKYHSFATGGSNWREFWFNESTVADAINDPDSGAVSQESCTQYNMLKIARRMFTWSGSPAMADYYELAMQNGVLGIQRKPHSHDDQHDHLHEHHQHHAHQHQRQHQHHLGLGREQVQEVPEQGRPASSESLTAAMTAVYETQPRPADHQVVSWPQDPGAMLQSSTGLATNAAGPGVMIYYLPQFAGEWKGERGHSWTGWGDPYNAFWCCYGSGVESFSKLADSIYFHRTVNASAAAGVAAATADAPPELFVNQLVTSSLEWKQQGVVVNQTADMYGPESAARARLVITTTDETGTVHFVLKWRIPAWTDPSAALVKVHGRNASCVPPAPVEGVADSGAQAFYCDLGPEWKSGDVVESFFPFKSRVESINDQRPENSRLKAVLVGPWVMAGVTDGKRNITADPRSIDTLLSMPSSADLVSLRPFTLERGMQNEGPILLTRHAANATLLAVPHPQSPSRAAAMDATFRLVPGADGACSDGSQGVEGMPLLTTGRCVSLEPMAHPGQRLRQQHDGSLTVVAGASAGVSPSVFTVAACSEPGNLCLRGASAGDKAGASPSIHLLAPAAPQYPLGSRVLRGLDSQYLLVPIGQIIDEHYTTYFEFLDPPAAVSM